MVRLLMQRQEGGKEKLLANEKEILSSSVGKKKLIEFITDSIVIDEPTQTLKLSITHLMSRMKDRVLLGKY